MAAALRSNSRVQGKLATAEAVLAAGEPATPAAQQGLPQPAAAVLWEVGNGWLEGGNTGDAEEAEEWAPERQCFNWWPSLAAREAALARARAGGELYEGDVVLHLRVAAAPRSQGGTLVVNDLLGGQWGAEEARLALPPRTSSLLVTVAPGGRVDVRVLVDGGAQGEVEGGATSFASRVPCSDPALLMSARDAPPHARNCTAYRGRIPRAPPMGWRECCSAACVGLAFGLCSVA